MKSLFLPLFTLVVALGSLPLQAQEHVSREEPDAHLMRGEAWSKHLQNSKDKAAKHPEDAEAHFELAYAYYRDGDVELGLKTIDHAIKLNPSVAKYHAKRAALLRYSFDMEDFEESNRAMDQALKLDPRNANYWYERAQFRTGGGWWTDKGSETLADLEKVLAINPKHVGALGYVGIIQLEQKKYDLAKATLKMALEIDQQNQSHAKRFAGQGREFANEGWLEPEDGVIWEEESLLLHEYERDMSLAGLIQIFEVEGNKAERDTYLARIHSMNRDNGSVGDFCREAFVMEDISFKAFEAFGNDSPLRSMYRFEGSKEDSFDRIFKLVAIPLPNDTGNSSQPANTPRKYRYEFHSYRTGWVFAWSKNYKTFDKKPSYEEVKAVLHEVLLGNLKHIPRNQSAAK